jgi:hypothetical protein
MAAKFIWLADEGKGNLLRNAAINFATNGL